MTKQKKEKPVLISACLLGLKTRYNCMPALSTEAKGAAQGRYLVPVCPEQLSGLPTPRPSAEIVGGTGADVLDGRAKVIDETGKDVTNFYIRGAKKILAIIRLNKATEILLKEKSPACGVKSIKDGTETVAGSGVTAALLKRNGFTVRGF